MFNIEEPIRTVLYITRIANIRETNTIHTTDARSLFPWRQVSGTSPFSPVKITLKLLYFKIAYSYTIGPYTVTFGSSYLLLMSPADKRSHYSTS